MLLFEVVGEVGNGTVVCLDCSCACESCHESGFQEVLASEAEDLQCSVCGDNLI